MATREDVTTNVTAELQRIAEVAAPAAEFTAQDIVDTLRVQEASFQGISYPSLLDAFGKQDLGGGVSVGITVSLQDTKVAFEGRTTPAETVSVTSVSVSDKANTQQFVDTAARVRRRRSRLQEPRLEVVNLRLRVRQRQLFRQWSACRIT